MLTSRPNFPSKLETFFRKHRNSGEHKNFQVNVSRRIIGEMDEWIRIMFPSHDNIPSIPTPYLSGTEFLNDTNSLPLFPSLSLSLSLWSPKPPENHPNICLNPSSYTIDPRDRTYRWWPVELPAIAGDGNHLKTGSPRLGDPPVFLSGSRSSHVGSLSILWSRVLHTIEKNVGSHI